MVDNGLPMFDFVGELQIAGFFSVYILALPVIVLIASFLSPWVREKTVAAITTSVELCIYAALVYLLWPSRAPRYFEVRICLFPGFPLVTMLLLADGWCYFSVFNTASVLGLIAVGESVTAGAKPADRGALKSCSSLTLVYFFVFFVFFMETAASAACMP